MRLNINENTDDYCEHCNMVLKDHLVKVKGVRGLVLRLEQDERLVIMPDYNSSNIMTHVHLRIVHRNQILESVV